MFSAVLGTVAQEPSLHHAPQKLAAQVKARTRAVTGDTAKDVHIQKELKKVQEGMGALDVRVKALELAR